VEKLLAVIMAQKPQSRTQEDFNAVLHEKDNAKMHQKSLTQYILRLGKVIQEGIELGSFSTPFPNESAEILLSAALTLFDDAYFQWTKEETAARTAAFLVVMERALGADAGSFSGFTEVFN
jgi:hypothetical protein